MKKSRKRWETKSGATTMSDPSQSTNPPPEKPPDSTMLPPADKNEASNLLASAALSASAASLASVASSKASVATNKSGIRPPSKIGRPCGDKHKPPLPAVSTSPSMNEIDDPLKKMIDEFGRHRLTDVLEEDGEEDQTGRTSWNGSVNRKRYSSSSPASSMDALWELHSHRLSEAGLSRHSDSSTILTEDTDSFIIGQRVWVGGNKPGHIAFIGETQFAPGEWAGIALDEPIGKNDGSVSGIRYFMCEPKKGVFSRLTRLTRVPLDHGGSADTFTFSTPSPHNGSHKKIAMSPSPTDSHRSMVKSPVSVFGSNTSLSSAHVDYRIGDRVIIKSGQGSKVGTVRFMGVTEFAPGEWVGVELDEPRGKNDGSVNGIRYFQCQPNFGLFAPISKVSKSPSKVKPNQCQVHSPTGGLPPSGMRRTNSKESMNSSMSMMTSASTAARRVRLGVTSLTSKKVPTKPSTVTPVPTRTALQEVLKEKQQHIEQLLKERDLERAEITRAASQAEEAEQKLAILTQEYNKYRSECEAQLQNHMVLLNQLKENRQQLVTQLEDEKKKNEDWQFKFEEAEITRADFQALNASHLLKIDDLEGLLAVEKARAESFESDANKLFETVEDLIKTKEENERLKKEFHETKNKHVALESNNETTSVLIKSLQDDLDQCKKDCDEKSEMINVLKKEITSVQESFKNQLELGEIKMLETVEKLALKDKEIEALKIELDNINKLASERNKTIEQLQSDNLNIEVAFQKELEKFKMDLSAKIADLETANDNYNSAKSNLEDVQKQLEVTLANLDTNNLEIQQYKNKLDELEMNLELSNANNAKIIIEFNKELENFEAAAEAESAKLNEFHKKTVDELTQQILNLKSDNETLQTQLNEEKNQIIEGNEKLQELLRDKQSMDIDLVQKISENNELKENVSSLEARLEIRSNEYESQNLENKKLLEELKNKSEELQQVKHDLACGEIASHTLESQLQTKLETERDEAYSSLKSKINEFENLLKEHEETKNSLKESYLEVAKKLEFADNLNNSFNQEREQYEKIINDHRDLVASLEKQSKELEDHIQFLVANRGEEIEQWKSDISELENQGVCRDMELQKLTLEVQQLWQKGKEDAEIIANLNAEIQNNNSSTAAATNLRQELDNVKLELSNAIEKLNGKTSETENIIQQKDLLTLELEDKVKELNEVKSELSLRDSTLEEIESRLNQELSEAKLKLNSKLAEIEAEKEQLLNLLDTLDQEAKEALDEKTKQLQGKDDLIVHLKNDVNTKLEEMNKLFEKIDQKDILLTTKDEQLTNLKQQLEQELAKVKSEKELLDLKVLQTTSDTSTQVTELEKKALEKDELIQSLILEKEKVKAEGELVIKEQNEKIVAVQHSESDLKIKINEMKLEEEAKALSFKTEIVEKDMLISCKDIEISQLKDQLSNMVQTTTTANGGTVENVDKPNGTPDYKQLLEDKLMAETQIQFLNSIIVDMQKKNEEQLMKIELLEKGFSSAATEELRELGFKTFDKQIAPRMYCDICEEFDLHETEDCPTQATDEPLSNIEKCLEKKEKPPPRPYCNICEEFDHDTADCTNDQEF